MRLPFYSRQMSQNNQICIPKEYLEELGVYRQFSAWKITLEKSRKRILLDLME